MFKRIGYVIFIFTILSCQYLANSSDLVLSNDGEVIRLKRDIQPGAGEDSGRLEIHFEVRRVHRLVEKQEVSVGFNVTGSCETGTRLRVHSKDPDIAEVVSTQTFQSLKYTCNSFQKWPRILFWLIIPTNFQKLLPISYMSTTAAGSIY